MRLFLYILMASLLFGACGTDSNSTDSNNNSSTDAIASPNQKADLVLAEDLGRTLVESLKTNNFNLFKMKHLPTLEQLDKYYFDELEYSIEGLRQAYTEQKDFFAKLFMDGTVLYQVDWNNIEYQKVEVDSKLEHKMEHGEVRVFFTDPSEQVIVCTFRVCGVMEGRWMVLSPMDVLRKQKTE